MVTFKLMAIGLLSAALFSCTFAINYNLALGGSHWVWTAVLRYGFTIALLSIFATFRKNHNSFKMLVKEFWGNRYFWILAGTLSCGIFYWGICISSEHMRGWMVAATFQLTVVASPLVLVALGSKVPKYLFPVALCIFIGTLMINFKPGESSFSVDYLLYVFIPLLLSAVCYPMGNQLVNIAKNGGNRVISEISNPSISDPFSVILLLCFGSIPFWIALIAITSPPPPTSEQWVQTFFVALISGVLATALFLYARNLTFDPKNIVAVDATQSTEVIFAMIIELIYINSALPNIYQIAGVALVTLGVFSLGLGGKSPQQP